MLIKTTIKILIISLLILSATIKSYSQMIPKDKQLHLYAGAYVGAWGMLTPNYPMKDNLWRPVLNGMIWAGAAGAGKELVYDKLLGWGTPDWKDFGATMAGAVLSIGSITTVRAMVMHHRKKSHNKEITFDNRYQINYCNIEYTFNHNVQNIKSDNVHNY